MIHFAYDGSLNGDWVAHYAIRLAARQPNPRLHLLHADDGTVSPTEFDRRLERIDAECRLFSVALEADRLRNQPRDVASALLTALDRQPHRTLVCGSRARPRNLAFLAGTVSERLLRAETIDTMVVRVVQPGVLGQPGRLLLPLRGHPAGATRVLPFLKLFGPDLEQLQVLHLTTVPGSRFRHLGARELRALTDRGARYLARIEMELRQGLAAARPAVDYSALVTDDVPREIVIQAGRHRSRLILLGATEKSLSRRILSGSPVEQVLRDAPCDVAVYRGAGR